MSKMVKLFVIAGMVLAGGIGTACAQRDGPPQAAAGRLRMPTPMTPVPPPPGTRIERDVAYGKDPAQKIDIYRPAIAKGAPILLIVHGGGWRNGDKGNARVVDNKVNHWIPKGFIVVSVGYRMLPQAGPLAQADDVAAALAFVQAQASAWGGDRKRIVLIGHSAGAHLVALLAAAPEIASKQGAGPWLGTIALDSAAYDIVQIMERAHFALYDEAFGTDRDLWRTASPTLRLKAAPKPMLLVCSTKRADACPPAEQFAAKVRSLGGRASVVPVDMTHGDINGQLGTPGDYTAKVDSFIASLGL